MIRKTQGQIEWLEFNLFAPYPELIHGVFLRHGGVSPNPYGSLNVGGNTGDHPENIAENRRRIFDALNVPQIVASRQVHGNEVICLTTPDQQVGDCDGIVTDQKNLGLLIKHADCQAAIFYDPIHQVLANVHSGWRGNVQNIYRTAVAKMIDHFGSNPQEILVGVSPSLGPDHAEFKNYQQEFPLHFWHFQICPNYFDLWAIARTQLEECGILSKHIEIASLCTYANSRDFFSYRRDKTSGRNATVAMLKS